MLKRSSGLSTIYREISRLASGKARDLSIEKKQYEGVFYTPPWTIVWDYHIKRGWDLLIKRPYDAVRHEALTSFYRQYGLMHDDCLNSRFPIVERALELLPEDMMMQRCRRLSRAHNLRVFKKSHLPVELQNYDPFVPYMAPYFEEAKFQIQEEYELLKYHSFLQRTEKDNVGIGEVIMSSLSQLISVLENFLCSESNIKSAYVLEPLGVKLGHNLSNKHHRAQASVGFRPIDLICNFQNFEKETVDRLLIAARRSQNLTVVVLTNGTKLIRPTIIKYPTPIESSHENVYVLNANVCTSCADGSSFDLSTLDTLVPMSRRGVKNSVCLRAIPRAILGYETSAEFILYLYILFTRTACTGPTLACPTLCIIERQSHNSDWVLTFTDQKGAALFAQWCITSLFRLDLQEVYSTYMMSIQLLPIYHSGLKLVKRRGKLYEVIFSLSKWSNQVRNYEFPESFYWFQSAKKTSGVLPKKYNPKLEQKCAKYKDPNFKLNDQSKMFSVKFRDPLLRANIIHTTSETHLSAVSRSLRKRMTSGLPSPKSYKSPIHMERLNTQITQETVQGLPVEPLEKKFDEDEENIFRALSQLLTDELTSKSCETDEDLRKPDKKENFGSILKNSREHNITSILGKEEWKSLQSSLSELYS